MSDWQPVPGYDGIYEIHRDGTVRSLDRDVQCAAIWPGGVNWKRPAHGRIMRQRPNPANTRMTVVLSRPRGKGQRRHFIDDLIEQAFTEPKVGGSKSL